MIDHRPQRRQADAARDDQDVPALGLLDGPARAERTAHPNDCARLAAHQRLRGLAHRAHRVDEAFAIRRIAADGDGQFAHSENPQHAELAWLESRQLRAVHRLQRQRKRIRRLLRDALHGPSCGPHRDRHQCDGIQIQ